MEVKKKKKYSKPVFTVFRNDMEQPLLVMSSDGVSLRGAGVDESAADDNGTNIWNN